MFLFISLLITAGGCTTEKDVTSNIDPVYSKEDFPYETIMNPETATATYSKNIAPSGDGIYFTLGEYLYFYDYASNETVFLCNKPNCKHNQETDQLIGQECNAYSHNAFYGGILDMGYLNYYDGHLYMYGPKYDFQTGKLTAEVIFEIEKDGSDRKIIHELDNQNYSIGEIVMHNGYLYYSTARDDSVGSLGSLYRINLTTGNYESEEIMKDKLHQIYYLFASGDYLYFSCSYLIDQNGNEHYNVIGRFDTTTDEYELIIEGIDELLTNFTIADDDLYYIKDQDTYIYDLSSKEETFFSDQCGQAIITPSYIYVCNSANVFAHEDGENTLEVYDRDYNLLDSTVLPKGTLRFIAGSANDDLFYFYYDPTAEDYYSLARINRYHVNDGNKIEESVFYETNPSEDKISGFYDTNDYGY